MLYSHEFMLAVKDALGYEGVESNDKQDPGGQTFFGISRTYWPHWSGWPIIDAWISCGRPAPMPDLSDLVYSFYWHNFWMRIAGNTLAKYSQAIANNVFEIAVNLGVEDAIRCLQEALNMQNQYGSVYPDLIVDGRLGKKTLRAYQVYMSSMPGSKFNNEDILFNCIDGEQYGLYKRNPKHEYFRGWFLRV